MSKHKFVTAKTIRNQQRFKNNDQMNLAYAGRSRSNFDRFKAQETGGRAAVARLEDGRLIADCPSDKCQGAEYVDPDDLRFYCHSCGNAGLEGKSRPVKISKKITALLEED